MGANNSNAAGQGAAQVSDDETDEPTTDLEGLTRALHRVQAVIEFELDGTILTANDNFLNAVGYTLDEIKGKHHRMFCEPDYAKSDAYHDFWMSLAAGEFATGEFKRVGKDGSEIWINASYNPNSRR